MDATQLILFVLILIPSVVLHELAHGYTADRLGDQTARLAGRLTLNPFKHLDLMGSFVVPLILAFSGLGVIGWAKPVPINPFNLSNRKWGPALVALAGPLTNILLAVIFAGLLRLMPVVGLESPIVELVFSVVVFINIILAFFNLLPVPPLDGHHVLFSLIPPKLERIKTFLRKMGIPVLLIIVLVLWKYIAPFFLLIYNVLTGEPLPFL